METIQTGSFCFGTLYGFITAGVIGLIANQIRIARLDKGRQNLALDRLPDAAHPYMTSISIVRASFWATFRLVGLFILLTGFISMSIAGLFYLVA